MEIDERRMLDDRQPQFAAASQAREMLSGNTRNVIINLELRGVQRMLPAHGNIRPRQGMDDGVIHQVRYRTAQLLLIIKYLELLIHRKVITCLRLTL